jgi:FkbM family methyltransferase
MEKRELDVFKHVKNNIKVVFDIGARTDLDYYDNHPNCEYHLFEPNNAFVGVLNDKISKLDKPNIKVNPIGLSDEPKKDCVYYNNVQSFQPNPLVQSIDEGHRFDISTLDLYVKENNIKAVDFIKIDTEGLDYLILKGGEHLLKSGFVKYIQVEYWDKPDKFFDLLKENYDLYLILEDNIINYMPTPSETFDGLVFTVKLNNEIINTIFTNLLNKGMGGNLFCVNKDL